MIKIVFLVSVLGGLLLACRVDADSAPADRIHVGGVSIDAPVGLHETFRQELPHSTTYCFAPSAQRHCATQAPSLVISTFSGEVSPKVGPFETSRDLDATLDSIVDYYSSGEPYTIERAENMEMSGINGIDVRVLVQSHSDIAISAFVHDNNLIIVQYHTNDDETSSSDPWEQYEDVLKSMRADTPDQVETDRS